MNFGGMTVTHDNPVSFTVFAIPQDYSDLVMLFHFTNGDSRYVELGATFEAGKKYRISNEYWPENDNWEYVIEEIAAIKKMDVEAAADILYKNAMEVYGLQ